MKRKIIFWGTYFHDFYYQQDIKVKKRIDFVLDIVRYTDKIPGKFFKFLTGTDGIFEIKVETTFKGIRMLSFFDEGNLVLVINCFSKKTRKTPKNEIELAEKLKNEYLEYKKRRIKK